MADVMVRNLDQSVARAVWTRAKRRGVSFEEEVRCSVAESVTLEQEGFARQGAACRAASRARSRPRSDGAVLVSPDRDTWG
jgi:plasmid stability protein